MGAGDWDERYAASGLVWSEDPNQFVVEQVDAAGLVPGAGRRALDLACGEGRNALWLAGRGWSVTGVDFSAAGLAKAAELAGRAGVAVDWITADATDWTPPAAGADLVVVAYLQLPAPERAAALDTAVAALAPGGTLIVVAHHTDNLEQGVGGPQHPAVLYSEQDVVQDATAAAARIGVDLEVQEAARRERRVPDAPRPALDAVVRLHRPGGAGADATARGGAGADATAPGGTDSGDTGGGS